MTTFQIRMFQAADGDPDGDPLAGLPPGTALTAVETAAGVYELYDSWPRVPGLSGQRVSASALQNARQRGARVAIVTAGGHVVTWGVPDGER